MAEILNNHLGWCWNPIKNGKNYQPQLVIAGFQPSTVVICLNTILRMVLDTARDTLTQWLNFYNMIESVGSLVYGWLIVKLVPMLQLAIRCIYPPWNYSNISPEMAILKMGFLFQRWDMWVSWRVFIWQGDNGWASYFDGITSVCQPQWRQLSLFGCLPWLSWDPCNFP